jgi:hypothetical protein
MYRELEVGDKTYKFELVRDSIRAFERAGFSMEHASGKPILAGDGLVFAGLWKHHKIPASQISDVADELYDEYGMENVIGFLTEEFMSVFTSGGASKVLPWKKKATEENSSETEDSSAG